MTEAEQLQRLALLRRTVLLAPIAAFTVSVGAGAFFGKTGAIVTLILSAVALVVLAIEFAWAKCPRCGDHFFTGVLRSRNPELGGWSLRRKSCVNCRLSL